AKQQIGAGQFTIPVTIGAEMKENPFLRADIPEVAAGIGMSGKPAAQVFAEIRARKNRF
ncbi:MAG TPA: hydroxyacylglutathione hydrolase C-terminal domain-containing protein, partial [Pseudolabrys sp.]|nr:hydroxyacylglutathione hydrolase C-terminal domain-containing protein [Pseudolabrys sp.]